MPKYYIYMISSEASARGPMPCSLGRTVPPDEYTEYHENVLQSYRHKQLNTQLQEYMRCQERQPGGTECKKNFQRPVLRPGPRWRSLYSAPPDLLAGGRETGCPFSNYPLLSALWTSLLLFPTPKLFPHLIEAGDALESHIGYYD